jgi:hypothetical protein
MAIAMTPWARVIGIVILTQFRGRPLSHAATVAGDGALRGLITWAIYHAISGRVDEIAIFVFALVASMQDTSPLDGPRWTRLLIPWTVVVQSKPPRGIRCWDSCGPGALPMRFVSIALISSLALGASDLRADDPATTTPGRKYQVVLEDFEAAKRAFASKLKTATTEEQRQEMRAQAPGPDDYYGRLLALAEAHPGEAAAVDALVWIVATSTNGYDAFKERGVRIKRAMDILASRHVDDPRVGRVCLELTGAATPLRDEFLHTIHAKCTDRRNKGRAWRIPPGEVRNRHPTEGEVR